MADEIQKQISNELLVLVREINSPSPTSPLGRFRALSSTSGEIRLTQKILQDNGVANGRLSDDAEPRVLESGEKALDLISKDENANPVLIDELKKLNATIDNALKNGQTPDAVQQDRLNAAMALANAYVHSGDKAVVQDSLQVAASYLKKVDGDVRDEHRSEHDAAVKDNATPAATQPAPRSGIDPSLVPHFGSDPDKTPSTTQPEKPPVGQTFVPLSAVQGPSTSGKPEPKLDNRFVRFQKDGPMLEVDISTLPAGVKREEALFTVYDGVHAVPVLSTDNPAGRPVFRLDAAPGGTGATLVINNHGGMLGMTNGVFVISDNPERPIIESDGQPFWQFQNNQADKIAQYNNERNRPKAAAAIPPQAEPQREPQPQPQTAAPPQPAQEQPAQQAAPNPPQPQAPEQDPNAIIVTAENTSQAVNNAYKELRQLDDMLKAKDVDPRAVIDQFKTLIRDNDVILDHLAKDNRVTPMPGIEKRIIQDDTPHYPDTIGGSTRAQRDPLGQANTDLEYALRNAGHEDNIPALQATAGNLVAANIHLEEAKKIFEKQVDAAQPHHGFSLGFGLDLPPLPGVVFIPGGPLPQEVYFQPQPAYNNHTSVRNYNYTNIRTDIRTDIHNEVHNNDTTIIVGGGSDGSHGGHDKGSSQPHDGSHDNGGRAQVTKPLPTPTPPPPPKHDTHPAGTKPPGNGVHKNR